MSVVNYCFPFTSDPTVRHGAVSAARWKLLLTICMEQDFIYDLREALIHYPRGLSYAEYISDFNLI